MNKRISKNHNIHFVSVMKISLRYHCAKERYVLDLKNTGYTNGIGNSMSFSVTICQSIKYSKLSGLRLAEIN